MTNDRDFLHYLRAGSQGKSYSFCPYCYNHPPFPGMKKGSGCNNCKHPDCEYSQASLGVSPCTSCDQGILVLDTMSAPNWQLACSDNRCSTVVSLFKNANKVSAEASSEINLCLLRYFVFFLTVFSITRKLRKKLTFFYCSLISVTLYFYEIEQFNRVYARATNTTPSFQNV